VLRDVPLILQLGALRQQTLATLLPAAANNVASAFRPHPGTKAVLVLPRTFRWLISAFHDLKWLFRKFRRLAV
jgi:hypothetical protein